MRVLYVTGPEPDTESPALLELTRLEPAFEIRTATGAAEALLEIRGAGGSEYGAIFLSADLPHNEGLALIASLRRDRLPIAIVAIVHEEDLSFFGPAMTAGADDVLVVTATRTIAPDETIRRVRHNRHVGPSGARRPLRVLYVGEDDLAWDLLSDMPFIQAEQADAGPDGECPLTLRDGLSPADAIIVDEHMGAGHALQAVRWLKAHAPEVPVVVLTSPTGGDIGGASLELGADDVVSKAGAYRRRLVAALYRHYLRRSVEITQPVEPSVVTAPRAELEELREQLSAARETVAAAESRCDALQAALAGAEARITELEAPARTEPDEETERLRRELVEAQAALAVAEARMDALASEGRALAETLAREHRAVEELQEAQAFERALRDRDREELSRVRHALNEERERRIVLEGTLRQTEDRSAEQARSLEAEHARARRDLESQLATAAERLHSVANETQALQTRWQNELAAQAGERDRLVGTALFGYATVAPDGRLLNCNEAFARMFGYDTGADAVAGVPRPFDGLADHAHVVAQLEAGLPVDRVESVVRRASGRPFHVVTSAAFLDDSGQGERRVERLVIDVDDRTQVQEQLRLARRLESAGRLAAEMSAELDPLLHAIADGSAPDAERRRGLMLVRQLLAFSRRQAKPAGLLSISEAIRRGEPLLRQIAGDGVTLTFDLDAAGTIAAGDDDAEQLLAALVFAIAACLPFGGEVAVTTRSVRSGFDERTELAVTASGYGVQTVLPSASLARLVTRCGGTVRATDDPGRTTALLVHLPC